uniref:Wiskott-Aldrich syndrome protein family member n=1 Tax=Elaeophora elaphi TaxID=1147741 RepID=A0A0R3RVN9_9BILA
MYVVPKKISVGHSIQYSEIMAGSSQFYEHSIKRPAQLNRSVKCPKLYGVVELEIEITELLENISIALHYLQKLDLFSATNCELQIFQNDIASLTSAVTNLKYKIQKRFKDIPFQEDIQCLTSSKENIYGFTSREMADKTWRNIHESKELDKTQSETSFQRRFTAGSSIIASEGERILKISKKEQKKIEQNLPQIAKNEQKKIGTKRKKQNDTKTNQDVFEEIIQDSGCNHSESEQSVNLSSYDFSNNSEVTTFPLSRKEPNVKERKESKNLKLRGIENSENAREIFNSMILLKQAKYEKLQSRQDSAKIQKIAKILNKVRCSAPRLLARTHLASDVKNVKSCFDQNIYISNKHFALNRSTHKPEV